jgi:hypothetical protein
MRWVYAFVAAIGLAFLAFFAVGLTAGPSCMSQTEFDTEFNPMSVRLRATRTDARAMAAEIIQAELTQSGRHLCPGVIVPVDPAH